MLEVTINEIEATIDSNLEVEFEGAQTSCRKNISNSDGTYDVNITEDLVLPDITVTDSDGSSSSFPSAKNVVCTPCVELQESYAYPILTQTTSYRDGDEGWQISNVWNSIYGDGATERVAVAELSDFYTLKTNNQFGNTSRFTTSAGVAASTGGANFDSEGEVVYDNYLGVQFVRFTQSSGTWTTYIDFVRSYDDGSWYPVPASIVAHIIDLNSSFLNDVLRSSSAFWTATTRKDSTTLAYRNFFTAGFFFDSQNKTSSNQGIQIGYKLI